MNKIKAIIIIILMIFSFYLSDKVTSLAINKNPIMETINKNSETLTVMGTNATIKDNTIIPGISGKQVDKEASFFKMKEFGAFNEMFLIYDNIKPKISLEDNKDKIIIQGNNTLRQVSIIIDDDKKLIEFFHNKNLEITVLAKKTTTFNNYEYINSENTKENFKDVESLLKKNKINKKICILEHSNIELCKEKYYYLVKPNIIINNADILSNKKNINNGSIIYISKQTTVNSLNIILKQIEYLDLKIVYLSKLIKE